MFFADFFLQKFFKNFFNEYHQCQTFGSKLFRSSSVTHDIVKNRKLSAYIDGWVIEIVI